MFKLTFKPITLVAIMIAATASLALAKDDAASNVPKQDKKFMMEAATGGMMEVQLGQYAAQHADNADVKAFGQKMVDDHTKANQQLMQIAQTKNVTLPAKLNKKHQAMVDKLSQKEGAAFDKAYMQAMLKDHRDDIKAFADEAENGKDADVKAFAAQTLPILKQHLQLAETAAASAGVKVDKSADQDAMDQGH
jgi:putative membrane protein